MRRLALRALHLMQRILRGIKLYKNKKPQFGKKVAREIFIDELKPHNKTERYIKTIEEYVDDYIRPLAMEYAKLEYKRPQKLQYNIDPQSGRVPIWCCWWQGEDSMTQVSEICYKRLKEVIDYDKARLILITLDNYLDYVTFPNHIQSKFKQGKITYTEMSDILRMALLSKYGGFWIDATVYISADTISDDFLNHDMYCQKMYDPIKWQREACKGRWCGFMLSGSNQFPLFKFVLEAFYKWWSDYESVIDYVLIDYFILSAYKMIPYVREVIDSIQDNNTDVFEMYTHFNEPYSDELYKKLTKTTKMHKLTNKDDFIEYTADGKLTLYGFIKNKELNDEQRKG